MAWTGVLGLAVGSVPAYASVHGSKLYVFPCSVTSAFFTESLPYTHMVAYRRAHTSLAHSTESNFSLPALKASDPRTLATSWGGVRIHSGGTVLRKMYPRDLITVQ